MGSQIAKILIRKGTNSDRQTLVLDQAEIGFTTDTKRMFVGDGGTQGGIPVSILNWGIMPTLNTLTGLEAEINDIAFFNSKTYSLTAKPASNLNNWGVISGAANGTVTNVEVGDFLNINGNPSEKSFNQQGAITVEVSNLLAVMYPVDSIFSTLVPYLGGTASTQMFFYLGQPGEFSLISGSYKMGVWNYLGTSTIATYPMYFYQRVG